MDDHLKVIEEHIRFILGNNRLAPAEVCELAEMIQRREEVVAADGVARGYRLAKTDRL